MPSLSSKNKIERDESEKIEPNFQAIKQEEIECACQSSYIEMGFACQIPDLMKCTECFPELTCKTRTIHGVSTIFKYILTSL